MPESSFADKMVAWEQLINSARPHLDEMPHLAAEIDALQTLIPEAKARELEQEAHRARFHEATRLREDAEKRGIDLRNRLVAKLQGHFGPKSERLREFGIHPRLPRRRRQTEEERSARAAKKESPAAES
jgi:hypothetical protein